MKIRLHRASGWQENTLQLPVQFPQLCRKLAQAVSMFRFFLTEIGDCPPKVLAKRVNFLDLLATRGLKCCVRRGGAAFWRVRLLAKRAAALGQIMEHVTCFNDRLQPGSVGAVVVLQKP